MTLVLYKLKIYTPVEYKLQIQHSIWNKILLWWINFTYVHYVLISLQILSFMLMYYRQWKIKRKPDPWPTIPQRKQEKCKTLFAKGTEQRLISPTWRSTAALKSLFRELPKTLWLDSVGIGMQITFQVVLCKCEERYQKFIKKCNKYLIMCNMFKINSKATSTFLKY